MAVSSGGLYRRCLWWGVATGVVAGAMTGAAVGLKAGIGGRLVEMLIGLPMVSGCYGAFFGGMASVFPTVVGALVVTVVLRWRHPLPADASAVRRDLRAVMSGLVLALDGGFLLALFYGGDGASSVLRYLAYVAVANAGAVVTLRRAEVAISRAWSGDAGQTPAGTETPTPPRVSGP